MTKFIEDKEIFEEVFLKAIPQAKKSLWIATADIKDLHVPGGGRKYVSFLGALSDLVRRGVEIRLIHAKEPGPKWRESFDLYPNLIDGLERELCPRNHSKMIIVDSQWLYMGSANLTGAGLGGKAANKRNFEAGIVSTEGSMLSPAIEKFDALWMGLKCKGCGRREFCADPIDRH